MVTFSDGFTNEISTEFSRRSDRIEAIVQAAKEVGRINFTSTSPAGAEDSTTSEGAGGRRVEHDGGGGGVDLGLSEGVEGDPEGDGDADREGQGPVLA